MSSKEVRLLIVDRHEMVAESLAFALGDESGLSVVAVAHTAASTREALRAHQPDVMVIDPQLADGDGIELVREAKRMKPDLAIVIMSGNPEPASIALAVSAGCEGYVPKTARISALASAARRAAAGEMAIASAQLEELAEYIARRRSQPQKLTARELEILQLLSDGLSTELLAQRLVVSTHTVRNHIRAILHKVGAHTRLEAVAIARQMGLLVDD